MSFGCHVIVGWYLPQHFLHETPTCLMFVRVHCHHHDFVGPSGAIPGVQHRVMDTTPHFTHGWLSSFGVGWAATEFHPV